MCGYTGLPIKCAPQENIAVLVKYTRDASLEGKPKPFKTVNVSYFLLGLTVDCVLNISIQGYMAVWNNL